MNALKLKSANALTKSAFKLMYMVYLILIY
jgi:hypothetical protein